MTPKQFQEIPDNEIFATGVLPNSPEGPYMTESGAEEILPFFRY